MAFGQFGPGVEFLALKPFSFFLFFPENMILQFMQIVSTVCIKCLILFLGKSKKSISKCHLLKF